ncbi:MAG: DNA mismatch endonuclease Vsr [Acidobacteria bacterium]|nr:DNA mismatch endonuclease Vsr [Acidobacteriota bacterium]MBI3427585.1 DNA mismatch endonuclease Vsr [Acidobacteriota bacterium]
MTDTVDAKVRSWIMSNVPQRHTSPERLVRSFLHQLGYRFRLHRRDLPGSPDIVLPKHRIAVFVHGCFWHQHRGCRKSRRPTSNTDYWNPKLDANVVRDKRKIRELKTLGWQVVVVWECETQNLKTLSRKFAILPLSKFNS